MDELYTRIEALCLDNHISITTMCKESGASRAPLSDLKMGRSKCLSTETLSKIASYFNVTVDYLLTGEQKEKPFVNGDEELTEYLEELKNRKEMRMLFSLTKGATKEDVERTVKIVEAALGKKANDD